MLIPRNVLSALPVCTDPESMRYALGGIKLERNGGDEVNAIATDGRRLLVARWSDAEMRADSPADIAGVDARPMLRPGSAFDAILPAKECQRLAKAVKPGKRIANDHRVATVVAIEETPEGREARAAVTNTRDSAVQTITAIEGVFPRWKDMLDFYREPDEGSRTVKVNAKMLGELASALAQLTTDVENYEVELTVGGKDRPVALKLTGGEVEATGLLMPLGCNGR